MSFFTLSDNTTPENTGAFESGGGDFEPIPKGTEVLAAVDEAKWDNSERLGDFISLRWSVLAPKEYLNRKVFQKVQVMNSDASKADKAKRMLMAIDANAGGKLMASGQAPTAQSLAIALVNKPMMLKLEIWEMKKDNGEEMSGNWVSAVSPRNSSKTPAATPTRPEFTDEDVGF